MPGEESVVLTDGGALAGSSTAVFQRENLSEASCVLLGGTDRSDLLVGIQPFSQSSEEW